MKELMIEVFKGDEELSVKEGVSGKTGKPYKMISQTGYAHLDGKFPVKMKIKVQDGQPAYPVGKYYLSMLSLDVNGFDELTLGRDMFLIPADVKAL